MIMLQELSGRKKFYWGNLIVNPTEALSVSKEKKKFTVILSEMYSKAGNAKLAAWTGTSLQQARLKTLSSCKNAKTGMDSSNSKRKSNSDSFVSKSKSKGILEHCTNVKGVSFRKKEMRSISSMWNQLQSKTKVVFEQMLQRKLSVLWFWRY